MSDNIPLGDDFMATRSEGKYKCYHDKMKGLKLYMFSLDIYIYIYIYIYITHWILYPMNMIF